MQTQRTEPLSGNSLELHTIFAELHVKKSGLILNDWKQQYWNFTGNQLLLLEALEAEFILKKGNPSLVEVFEVIQNLKLVLTLKRKVRQFLFLKPGLFIFCYVPSTPV